MADIKIEDLTTGYVDGTGVFDTLMTAVQSRLDEQYIEGRLKGSDYATAYLGSMQYAMSQAIQFLLGEQQADKQADLLQAQIDEISLESARKDSLNTAQINLLIEQVASSQAATIRENSLATSQTNLNNQKIAESVAAVTRENNLANSKISLETSQKALLEKQALEEAAKTLRENRLADSKILLDAAQADFLRSQKDKIDKELLILQKELEIKSQDLLIKQQELLIKQQELLIAQQQKLKIEAEVALLNKKALTEAKQPQVMDAQIKLYNRQTKGFTDDARHKFCKVLLDTWAVMASADPEAIVKPSFIATESEINGLVAGVVSSFDGLPYD